MSRHLSINKIRDLLLLLILMAFSSYSLSDIAQDTSPIEKPVANFNTLPDHSANLTEVFFSLIFIVILIFFLAWVIKRIGYHPINNNQLMKVVATLPVTAKEKIVLVQVGEEQIVIGVAPGFVGNIKTLDKPITLPTEKLNQGEMDNQAHKITSSFSNIITPFLKGSHNDKK